MTLTDYDGLQLLDFRGEIVGSIVQTYVDAKDVPQFVEVRVSDDKAAYRLVPLQSINQTAEGLRVPFGTDLILGSPASSELGDIADGTQVDRVVAYYDQMRGAATDQQRESRIESTSSIVATKEPVQGVGGPVSTEIRDLGDVVEIPIVEEVLVKTPVVREVIRVRKHTTSGIEKVAEDVRHEDVEIEQDDNNSVTVVDDAHTSPGRE